MNMLLQIVIGVLTFCGMEFMAWFSHKYIMHGFLWMLHKDHHQPKKGWFERNDSFFLFYAAISTGLVIAWGEGVFSYGLATGLGILFYGIVYFVVHDIFIHQRLSWLKRTDNSYLRAIRKAHKVHHKHMEKGEGECFGMLIVPSKYYKEANTVKQ